MPSSRCNALTWSAVLYSKRIDRPSARPCSRRAEPALSGAPRSMRLRHSSCVRELEKKMYAQLGGTAVSGSGSCLPRNSRPLGSEGAESAGRARFDVSLVAGIAVEEDARVGARN